MIVNIRHKGLKSLHGGSAKGVEAVYVKKLRFLLYALEGASMPEELNLPGFRLHPLKGDLKGFWSITVGANWRVIFRFKGLDVCDVDMIDYHGK